jgi:hypothetical protein
MIVKAKTVFLEGRFRAQPGRIYAVPDRVGGRLVGNGWAEELPDDAEADETPDPAEFAPNAKPAQDGATLQVAGVKHGVDSTIKGA